MPAARLLATTAGLAGLAATRVLLDRRRPRPPTVEAGADHRDLAAPGVVLARVLTGALDAQLGRREVRLARSSIPRSALPSVNVGNAERWGRVAALGWWTQDLPNTRPGPPDDGPVDKARRKALRWRHQITGDRSVTPPDERGRIR